MTTAHQKLPMVRFYQLAAMPLEKALVGILDKALDRKMATCLLANDPNHARWLDDRLWSSPYAGFLPHGLWSGPDPDRHPILISLEPDQRNGASLIVMTTPKLVEEPERFEMVIDFVQERSEQDKIASRHRYRHYQNLGCVMEYWIQTPRGGWQKKTTTKA